MTNHNAKQTTVITTAQERRRLNLKTLARQEDGPTNLARRLGYSGPSYISQMLSGHRKISEDAARTYEQKLNLPAHWLDQDHTTQEQPAPVDTSLVSLVVASVGASFSNAGIQPNPNKFAEAVAMVYEGASTSGEVDEQLVQRIIKLLK